MPVLFVGNKKDLIHKSDPDQRKAVNSRQVQEIANAYGFLKPIEASAKTGDNVSKIFQTIASELLEKEKKSPNRQARVQRSTKRAPCCH